jgi:PAS domain S-box-containing protein
MIATLQESEALHKFIVHNSPDLVYMLDHQGNFTFVNKNTADRLGYSRKELLGRHYSSVVYPEDLDLAQRYFMADSTLAPRKRRIATAGQKEGNIIHVEIRSVNIERKLAGGYRLGRTPTRAHLSAPMGLPGTSVKKNALKKLSAFRTTTIC